MHESMVTPEGHLLIRMARMTLTNRQRLDTKWGASHADVVAILKNLDIDVLQLVADTPMLKQWTLSLLPLWPPLSVRAPDRLDSAYQQLA